MESSTHGACRVFKSASLQGLEFWDCAHLQTCLKATGQDCDPKPALYALRKPGNVPDVQAEACKALGFRNRIFEIRVSV